MGQMNDLIIACFESLAFASSSLHPVSAESDRERDPQLTARPPESESMILGPEPCAGDGPSHGRDGGGSGPKM